MPRVYASSVIPAPSARVWKVVRNFNGFREWAPFIADSHIENDAAADQVGCVRKLRLADGGLVREQLLALSDADMSCSYSILESPMGVADHAATLSLRSVTDGDATFIEWRAEFTCPPGRESAIVRTMTEDVFHVAFAALKRRLAR